MSKKDDLEKLENAIKQLALDLTKMEELADLQDMARQLNDSIEITNFINMINFKKNSYIRKTVIKTQLYDAILHHFDEIKEEAIKCLNTNTF